MQPTDNPVRTHQQEAILISLARGSARSDAATAAGISRRTLYNWMEADSEFKEAVEDAECQCVDAIETLAFTCARMAADDPRYQRTMLAFLKARSPNWRSTRTSTPSPAQPTATPEPQPAEAQPAFQKPPPPPGGPDFEAFRATLSEGERAWSCPFKPDGPRDGELLITRSLARLHDHWQERVDRQTAEGIPPEPPPLPEGYTSPITCLYYERHKSIVQIADLLNLPLEGEEAPPLPCWPPPEHLRNPKRIYRTPENNASGVQSVQSHPEPITTAPEPDPAPATTDVGASSRSPASTPTSSSPPTYHTPEKHAFRVQSVQPENLQPANLQLSTESVQSVQFEKRAPVSHNASPTPTPASSPLCLPPNRGPRAG